MSVRQFNQKQVTNMKADLMDCPGAWYGNSLDPITGRGNITIDPTFCIAAIRWLNRRFDLGDTGSSGDGSITIDLYRKGTFKRMVSESVVE